MLRPSSGYIILHLVFNWENIQIYCTSPLTWVEQNDRIFLSGDRPDGDTKKARKIRG